MIKKRTVVAIIQARMSATRLPGKVLKKLHRDVTVLEYMLNRVAQCKEIEQSIVATTTNPNDAIVADFLKEKDIPYFVGSEHDVLDRYYQAAKTFGAAPGGIIVRLTADCPVIDPQEIDKTVRFFKENDFDYASNNLEPYLFPDGMDTEVFSFEALERAWKKATQVSHREHVTFYFWKNPLLFKIGQYVNPNPNQDGYRLTLDYPSDFDVLQEVTKHFAPRIDYSMQEIIDFLDAHPEIKKLNSAVARNASWQSA